MKKIAITILIVFGGLYLWNKINNGDNNGECLTECDDCKGKGINYSKEDISRFVISWVGSVSPQKIKSKKITDYLYSVSYTKGNEEKHEYVLKYQWKGESCSRVNRAYWAVVQNGVQGRWRDTQHDESIEFKQENDEIVIRIVYPDGSESIEYFGRQD